MTLQFWFIKEYNTVNIYKYAQKIKEMHIQRLG